MSAIQTIIKSVEDHSMVKYRGQSIDAFSASAILAVYNALSGDNKQKYEKIIENSFLKAATIAFKLTKPKGS